MINSVSSSSPVYQAQAQQHQQAAGAQKPKAAEPQDSVVLSKAASGQGDVDHDGDSR